MRENTSARDREKEGETEKEKVGELAFAQNLAFRANLLNDFFLFADQ